MICNICLKELERSKELDRLTLCRKCFKNVKKLMVNEPSQNPSGVSNG